ncbi:hypothetical protein [Clostridium sp.]|jgi:hypothetical protein|uniref:hypothetical protein n=1 Tax=Clostridium sp. TaxID=1506 RepID=UPI003EE873A4
MYFNILTRLLLLLVPAGLFIYLDKSLLISNKIQVKLKIKTFLGLYAFIMITLALSALLVATIAWIISLSSDSETVIQTMLIGTLLGLFSNIQKLLRSKLRR